VSQYGRQRFIICILMKEFHTVHLEFLSKFYMKSIANLTVNCVILCQMSYVFLYEFLFLGHEGDILRGTLLPLTIT
jgi:hypothetical protein